MSIDWTTLITGLVGGGLGGALIKTVLDHWLNVKRSSKAEERQLLQKKREASLAVAEILSEWVRPSYTGQFSNEDRWRLQSVYWKNILWLDKALLDLLRPILERDPKAPGTNEMIVQARKVLLGLDTADLSGNQLNTWMPDERENSTAIRKVPAIDD